MKNTADRKLRRVKAAFRKWFSPVRWVALTIQLVHRYVHRNTIIFFAALEMLVSILIAVVFYIYPDIDDVGYVFKDWKWFSFFSLIRCVCAAVGIFAALNRKVNTMKSYFTMTVFNLFVAVLLIAPFFVLNCKCSSFRQCTALSTFTSHKLDNPWPEPNKVKYETIRRVPFSEPPERLGGMDYELGLEELEVSSVLEIGSDSASDDWGGYANSQVVRGLNVPPINGSEPEKVDLLSYYNVSLPMIRWTSDEKTDCATVVKMDGAAGQHLAFTLASVLGQLGAGTMKLDRIGTLFAEETPPDAALTMIVHTIWHCATEDACAIVEVRIHRDAKTGSTKMEVCELHHQAVPSLAEAEATRNEDLVKEDWAKGKDFSTWKELSAAFDQVFEDDVKPLDGKDMAVDEKGVIQKKMPRINEFHIFFQKDPVRASAGYLLAQRLFNRQDMSLEEGTKLMIEVYNQECVCERQTGCQTYYDANNQPKHWCYVNQGTVRFCLAQGIKVYRAKDSLKWFSEEICENAGCRCMGIGAAPGEQETAKEQELEPNQLNYGSSCKKWSDQDTEKWCNVGFDTTCNDRTLPEAMDNKHAVSLYRSSIPCDQKQKGVIDAKAQQTCLIVRVLSVLMLLMLNLLGIPMTMIIFTFVKNRCGDEFDVDSQFDVKFSSDSESDDDWDVDKGSFAKTGTGGSEQEGADEVIAAAKSVKDNEIPTDVMEATSFQVNDQ